MTQPLGRNDHVGKLKEVIANTQDNIGDTSETLVNVNLTNETREKLQSLNERRRQSVQEFKSALENEFTQ